YMPKLRRGPVDNAPPLWISSKAASHLPSNVLLATWTQMPPSASNPVRHIILHQPTVIRKMRPPVLDEEEAELLGEAPMQGIGISFELSKMAPLGMDLRVKTSGIEISRTR